MEAVQGGLGGDLLGLALAGECGVGDRDLEVLFHAVALQRGTDREADLIGARKPPGGHVLSVDVLKVALGRGEQLAAGAGTLRTDERVAAHDQPLTGKLLRCGDLREVLLVPQRRLENTGSGELLDRWRLQRGDPVDPVSVREKLDVGFRDDPAIRHHDDALQGETVLEPGDPRQRLVVMQLAAEHLDRDGSLAWSHNSRR